MQLPPFTFNINITLPNMATEAEAIALLKEGVQALQATEQQVITKLESFKSQLDAQAATIAELQASSSDVSPDIQELIADLAETNADLKAAIADVPSEPTPIPDVPPTDPVEPSNPNLDPNLPPADGPVTTP